MPHLTAYSRIQPENWLLTTTDAGIALAAQQAEAGTLDDEREEIRQWLLKELLTTYHYPEAWPGTRILAVGPANTISPHANAFGLCLQTVTGAPFLWAIVDAPGQAKRADQTLQFLLLAGQSAGMGVSTDGTPTGTKFLRRRFDSDRCEYVADLEMYHRPARQATQKTLLAEEGVGKTPVQQAPHLPPGKRAEALFFEAHSRIRDIDGMHADEALDELCKMLYARLYDEENATHQQSSRLQRWRYGTDEEAAATIRTVYAEANAYDSRVFSLKIPGYRRSRGVFDSPIRLSSPALNSVFGVLEPYDITHSGIDVKGRMFQKVLSAGMRADMGQYFTPQAIADCMVAIAQPTAHELILDPFCGSAHFLAACLREVRAQTPAPPDATLYAFAFEKLHGIEKSDRMVRIAMTDMRLQGDGHSNIRCTDALLDFANYPDLQPESFDLVLTNPPFGSLLNAKAMAHLGHFTLATGRKSVPLEVLGLERCIQFLRPGGRLGIILPDGLLANQHTTDVREWLAEQAKLRAILSLPIETFTPLGATIKTSIVFLRKWSQGEAKVSDYPVFLARIDNVGYDASGRPREGSELNEVRDRVMAFFRHEGW